VEAFALNSLRWLKPGGHLFFRESCFHQSGNAKRRFNPTKYRHPDDYSRMFGDATLEDGSRFQLCATNCVEAYAQMKGNVHQMWFRWEKVDAKVSERQAVSLSTQQYSLSGTLRYECIYGKNYITTGGNDIADRMLQEAGGTLKPGSRVVDIGCGLGGMLLHLHDKCEGTYLHGVSFNSGLHAVVGGRHVDRPKSLRDRVSFSIVTDCGVPATELSFPPNTFDVAFMREALMYVETSDKPVLLRKISRLLRPGASFVLTDYCSGRKLEQCGDAFQQYVKDRRYSLISADAERELLERYFKVKAVDVTEEFKKFLRIETDRAREAFGPRETLPVPTDSDEEQLARKVADLVHAEFPGLPSIAAASAAKSAMESVRLHMETEKVEQARRAEDLKWAEQYWNIKHQAVESGDLQWYMFVATKE
jgi:phosphoethanolamine N-methyltransferase